MTWTGILFTILATVTAASALMVVVSRSVVRSAVGLLFTLIGVSILYFLLGADFLGAAQLIVYVGGTMVLMVFGVMITNQGPFAGIAPKKREWLVGGLLSVLLFGFLTYASIQAAKPAAAPAQTMPGVHALGESLLGLSTNSPSAFLLPFEIISIHLLVVLIAAAYLARPKRKIPPGEQP